MKDYTNPKLSTGGKEELVNGEGMEFGPLPPPASPLRQAITRAKNSSVYAALKTVYERQGFEAAVAEKHMGERICVPPYEADDKRADAWLKGYAKGEAL